MNKSYFYFSPAYELLLEGNKEGFEVVNGLTTAKWDRLAG